MMLFLADHKFLCLQNVPFVTRFVDKENKSEDFLSLFRGIVQDPNGRGTVPTIIGVLLIHLQRVPCKHCFFGRAIDAVNMEGTICWQK